MEKDRLLSERINAGAWIVNWICIVIIFAGLVMLERSVARTSELRTIQFADIYARLNEAAERDKLRAASCQTVTALP